jgi:hypothetical protein
MEKFTGNATFQKGRRAMQQAYLLRLWREPHDQVWRASLKTTADDQEIAFANLDELFVYLLRWTELIESQIVASSNQFK